MTPVANEGVYGWRVSFWKLKSRTATRFVVAAVVKLEVVPPSEVPPAAAIELTVIRFPLCVPVTGPAMVTAKMRPTSDAHRRREVGCMAGPHSRPQGGARNGSVVAAARYFGEGAEAPPEGEAGRFACAAPPRRPRPTRAPRCRHAPTDRLSPASAPTSQRATDPSSTT